VPRSAGRTILVNTGLGNDKQREVEVFDKRDGDFTFGSTVLWLESGTDRACSPTIWSTPRCR
jgi:hypothetical protein